MRLPFPRQRDQCSDSSLFRVGECAELTNLRSGFVVPASAGPSHDTSSAEISFSNDPAKAGTKNPRQPPREFERSIHSP